MSDLYTIHLHGALAKRFAPSYRLAVSGPMEAVQALACMLPGFEAVVLAGSWRCIVGPRKGGRSLDRASLNTRWRANEHDFHLVPAVQGRGGRGTGKIILGVVVMVAAVAFSVATAGAGGVAASLGANMLAGTAAAAAGMSVSLGGIAMMGAMIALGGIAQSISPQPTGGNTNGVDQRASFLFNNIVNTVAEGNCVPLIYGRTLVGSQVIAMGVVPHDLPSNPLVANDVIPDVAVTQATLNSYH